MGLFIPIRKIVEQNHLIYGIATAEEVDHAQEIMDYASSKPYIAAWSDEFKEATDGKSLGNLRAMHSDVSAGKLTEIRFDDQEKNVAVCVQIVDAQEWDKVMAGIYTGFSFGGEAVRRWWDDDLKATRYTLKPCELSLADKPCIPSATIAEIVKIDGSIGKLQLQKGRLLMKKVKKTMDLAQFAGMMTDVNNAMSEDDNTPEALKEAVQNLVNVLGECTQDDGDPEKTDEGEPAEGEPGSGQNGTNEPEEGQPKEGQPEDPEEKPGKGEPEGKTCGTEKAIMTAVTKALQPFQDTLNKHGKAIEKINTELVGRIEKVEKTAQDGKVVLKTAGLRFKGKAAADEDDALDKIKADAPDQSSWAY